MVSRQAVQVRALLFGLLAMLTHGAEAGAQDLEVGRTGWHVERLANRFVLLRAEISDSDPGRAGRRQGLLLMTCDHQARRIRFQLGETPQQPSSQAAEFGRAMVQGERESQRLPGAFNARVRFYPDGSFEFLEAIGFSESAMREFLDLLEKLPNRITLVLFKGPDTGAFRQGTVIRLTPRNLDESLVSLYGFGGLCYRAAD